MRAGIALGSNLGDRLGHLRAARERLLELHEDDGPFLSSKIYETLPMDCPPGSAAFLNAVIELSTSLPPLDLLARLQAIEVESGRPNIHDHHAPRTLDLDLLYMDKMRISHSALILPHPRISERLFVLLPLADICPERILPNVNHSVRELCEMMMLNEWSSGTIKLLSNF